MDDEDEQGVEVPYDRLAPDTLRHLLEDFATRDGTEYGAVETPLDVRVARLMAQLRSGEARILFSQQSQSVNIVHRNDVPT